MITFLNYNVINYLLKEKKWKERRKEGRKGYREGMGGRERRLKGGKKMGKEGGDSLECKM